jgi:hypothetical protein
MQKLNDIVAISGLLLTLTTFLFNLAWPNISKSRNLVENTGGPQAKEKSKKIILKTVWFNVVPLFLGFLFLFYVNLPTTCSIISTNTLSLWDFDVDNTLFVMVAFALLCFVVFNGYLIYELFIKAKKFKA